MTLGFYFELYRKDLTNLSFLKHKKFDGFLITMHQSGTHWLKHMLACAIADEKNLAPPKYAYAGDMIGGHKDPVKYQGIPLFGHSHNIPSFLISLKILKIIKRPKYVILVRDIRSMLVSHYEKYKHEYNCNFAEYLRGNPRKKQFVSDIWWCIRFQNAWGRAIESFPEDCLLIKYENLETDTLGVLKQVNGFLGLNLNEKSLRRGIEESTKEKMKAKPLKPKHKMKNKQSRVVVRTNKMTKEDYFSEEDRAFIKDTCKKYLKYDFGYKY